MERDRERQLIVIGGGPGGMAAARAAARAGVRPLLVQMGPIGGDCTFTGCVPSKTLIEAAARGERFTEAIAATHRAVEAIAAQEDDDVVRGEGIDVLHGWATFRSPREVELDGTVLRSERVVIATGAGPAVPPIPGPRIDTARAAATSPSAAAPGPDSPGRADRAARPGLG